MLYLYYSYSDEDKQCSYSVVNLQPASLSGSVKSGKYIKLHILEYRVLTNTYIL